MTCSYLSGTPRSPQKHSLYRHAATKLEIYGRSSEKAAWTEPQAPKRQVESSAKPLGTGRIARDRIAYLAISKTAHKAALSQRGGRTTRYNITAGDRSSVVVQGTGQAYRGPRSNFSASLSRCCGQKYHHLVSHGAPGFITRYLRSGSITRLASSFFDLSPSSGTDRRTTIWFLMDPPDLCLDTLICPQYSPCLLFFRPVPKFQDEGSHVCCFTYVSGPSRREADEIDQGCLLGRGQVEFLEQAGDRSSVLDLSQMLELASFFFDLSPNSGTEDPMFVALPTSMGHRGGGRRDRSGVPG
jgi:hypothetical protein